MSSKDPHVAVTVATRGRSASCRRLVEALIRQRHHRSWQVRIIVIDNNPQPDELVLPLDPRIEVHHEPRPGIPHARNRALDASLPWADVLVFIDDDEVPADDTWLATLVQALDEYDADVVSGPVVPLLPERTPPWVSEHPVIRRPRRPDGSMLRETYTGNTAARATVFAGGRRFDERFARTGGSDTLLFRQSAKEGARIRYVAAASVIEEIPPERARVSWILRRSFRIGANRIQFLRASEETRRSEWCFVLVGSALELLLVIPGALAAVVSRDQALRLLGRAVRGSGALAATIGVLPRAYPIWHHGHEDLV